MLWCVIATIACHMPMLGQTLSTDDGIKRWEADFRGGLNTDGYQFDLGIAFFPIQYIGVKAQLGIDGEIKELGDWGVDDIDSHHSYASRFKFTPAAVLRTPELIHWKSKDAGIYIFAEPGIILSPGASGSKKAECFNWDLKTGINIQVDQFIFTIGYGVTNFCLYSGFPTNHWGWRDTDDYITHSGFIGGAYKF
ncbi:MAG: hypothetical protein K2L93_01010 [Muribaculaceae bacterium]|nr:hypothetical protein [Muribaculaceae bacterium]